MTTADNAQSAPATEANVFIVGESPDDRSRRDRKRALRTLNERVWDGDTGISADKTQEVISGVFKLAGSLDSSLKKNTAFIKRLRTSLNADNQSALLKDISSLSLEKYIPEVVSAASEGLTKCKSISDSLAAVEVISALHQRFGTEFTPGLTVHILRSLAPSNPQHLQSLTPDQREKEESARLVRQRVFLRVTTELWLVSVIRTLADAARTSDPAPKMTSSPAKPGQKPKVEMDTAPLPLAVLKELLGKDREHVNLPLLVAFTKNFSYDVLGVKVTTIKKPVDLTGENAPESEIPQATSTDNPLCDQETQDAFRDVVSKYFTSVKAHIIRSGKHIQEQSRRNKEAYVRSGEVFADRETAFQSLVKTHEKLVANAQVLADVLGAEMPEMPAVEAQSPEESLIRGVGTGPLGRTEEFVPGGLWEDEEAKRFYEDIIDLKDRVPPTLLEDAGKGNSDKTSRPASPELTRDEQEGSVDGESASDTSSEHSSTPDALADTTITNKGVGQKVDLLLMKMLESSNRDLIDGVAVEFIFLNSKPSRNRLVKKLIDVPRNRQDILPYYSRLIATLSRYIPDIGKLVIDELNSDFRRLQRKKTLTDARFLNIRYIAELTKFRIAPHHVVFHILKVLLEDFSHANIELISQFLEACGRFLYASPDTTSHMSTTLETMQRKMNATHLTPPERAMLQNAFYYCNPPDRPSIQTKQRTPLELFIRKLIYLDLSKRTVSNTLKTLRKLPWQDPLVFSQLQKIFTKPWKLRFGNIYYLAQLVATLARYHPDFVIMLVDSVFEHIRVGLEMNLFVHNQRRVATVRYLGELYNFRVIETQTIFDTLYLLLGFGYDGGRPRPGVLNPLDLPNDFFRLHLVCALLDTCGQCFDRGKTRKQLDQFLAYFQYYIFTKNPVSMDVKFEIGDLFEKLRPNAKIHESLEEAAEALNEIASRQTKRTDVAEMAGDGSEGPSEKSEDEQDEHPEDEEPEEDEQVDETDIDEQETLQEEEEEDVVLLNRQVEPEVDEEFNREFSRMMSESLESRKATAKSAFDLEPPTSRARMPSNPQEQHPVGDTGAPPRIQFAVMSRRTKQMKTVDIPSENALAQTTLKHIEDAKAEKQRIKNLVLNLDRKAEEDERRQVERLAANNGIRLTYADDKKKRPPQSSWNYKDW